MDKVQKHNSFNVWMWISLLCGFFCYKPQQKNVEKHACEI